MIPFCKTDLGKEESDAVAKVIDSGWVVLGPKSQEFEEKFAEYVGAKFAVFVDSGTAALFLAAKYLKDIQLPEGTPVFKVPSFTFAATAESLIHAGFGLMFEDVDENYVMKDPDAFSCPVHLTGNLANPKASLIYDSAHRIEKDDIKESGGLWCYSFYATKNITTVTGGMICTNNEDAAKWLKKARDHGLDLGTKERYTEKYKQYDVQFVGWRVKGDDFRAVVGLEQLKKLPRLTERRNELVARYNKAFGRAHTGNHLYPIFVQNRREFVEYMFNQGIQTTVHFRPLHTMTAYKDIPRLDLTNTEKFGESIVSLPLFPRLTNEEQDHIIKTVLETKSLI